MPLATDIRHKLSNGKEIPALGLGTVSSGDPNAVKDQVKTAIEAGYRHIDTAWFYGTEEYVGEGIRESIAEGIVKREELFVTTKVWPSWGKNPEKSFQKSLADLKLDYVDLLLQHWPVVFKNINGDGTPGVPSNDDGSIAYEDDPNGTEFIEFYKRIEKLFLDSPDKIKSIGVSNYSIKNLEKLLPQVKVTPVVNQFEYHPELPQQNLVEYSAKHGIHVVAYSPLGGKGAPVLQLPLIQELAKKYDVTTNEIAQAYHILQGRSCIPRSSNLNRIKSNIRLPPLTKEELDQLYQIGVKHPKRYITPAWKEKLGFEYI